jgi:SAM-dependent methyltransferase
MKRIIRKYVPLSTRRRIRDLREAGNDAMHEVWDRIRGKQAELIPPERLVFVGKGDFIAIGNEFRSILVRYAGLKSGDRVLEVGCGIGRMAIPLIDLLSENGRYEGFDIVRRGIRWAQRNITSRHPNFRFQLADIRNQEYNPRGRFKASEYRFPFENDSFDVVFLTSVFTHMLPSEVHHYLNEIHRVLRPGGVCLITWFILNEESRSLLAQGKSEVDFRYSFENCLTTSLTTPEDAMGYPEEFVRELYSQAGLVLRDPILYGSWCARTLFLSNQDVCIADKAPG